MVTAIIRVAARIGSAITSAYERALHIPPGSSKTVCLAPTAPDSTISHSRSTTGRLAWSFRLALHECLAANRSVASVLCGRFRWEWNLLFGEVMDNAIHG